MTISCFANRGGKIQIIPPSIELNAKASSLDSKLLSDGYLPTDYQLRLVKNIRNEDAVTCEFTFSFYERIVRECGFTSLDGYLLSKFDTYEYQGPRKPIRIIEVLTSPLDALDCGVFEMRSTNKVHTGVVSREEIEGFWNRTLLHRFNHAKPISNIQVATLLKSFVGYRAVKRLASTHSELDAIKLFHLSEKLMDSEDVE